VERNGRAPEGGCIALYDQPDPYCSGNDQVRALGVRATLRTGRRIAGGAGHDARLAQSPPDSLDHRCNENPRTKMRALATGALSVSFAWLFTIMAIALFFVAAWQLNPLALKLAPVALAILFFYSFTKRFTHWSHLFLGFALGISPAAAWIAITGGLDWRMLILCAAVTLWVGGFDVLYACQDVQFDAEAGLYSVPKRFGIASALLFARTMHIGVVILLSWLATSFGLPWPAWAGIAVVAGLLAYEHSLVHANDLSKLNAAFFTVNGYISILFLLFWGAAVAVWRV
jgi:4-hydroxybenzoate polyprenyltransferase